MKQNHALKLSFQLAWPISLQQVLMTMLGMIDVMMVGHLGNSAVAAVGLGNRVQFVILVIFAGLGTALSILSSQYWGAKNVNGIRSAIVLASTTGAALLLPLIIALFLFAESIIAWGTNDAEVIALGADYIRLTIPALIFSYLLMVFEASLRSVGQVKTPLVISAIAVIANILMNWVFIFGAGPVPAMGVAGAAIATSVARAFHLAMLVGYLIWRRHLVLPRVESFAIVHSLSAWRRYLTISLPMMLNFGIWSSGTFVYAILYGRVSTEALAVASMLAPVEGILISLFFGMASASAIMVGHQLGANNHQQAWNLAKNFALFCPIVAVLVGGLLALNIDLVLMPYNNLDTSTIDQARQIIILIAAFSWLKITNMTLSMGVLRTGGQNKYCLLSDTFGMWCIGIPMTVIAVYLDWGFFYIYLMVYTEEVTKAVLFVRKLIQKTWMQTLAA
ncbi:MATE family efflux transporter [Echinimonas agarilytica]|uniref:MATE family efflux transporter n=1 Tax=Echinimonas agarilytica TaxID=1215918 RepID=A0AA41W8D6_9GAMM|nr:MATE family efflux transporter [Echinimonas agarilytica]MCM2680402.1 MATE family efflux transporter [Echinimonas agarilytica]